MLVVDSALGDGRDNRSQGTPALAPPVDTPDATWRVEEARGLGFDEPRPCKPVKEHHGRRRGEDDADQTDVGSQEGCDPLPDGSQESGDHEHDQGEQRQGDEEPEVRIQREDVSQGAEEFIAVGHNRNGVPMCSSMAFTGSDDRAG
jgi:hypothetical protein